MVALLFHHGETCCTYKVLLFATFSPFFGPCSMKQINKEDNVSQ